MEIDIYSVVKTLDLRVFVEYDDTYCTYVARCVDTGAVAVGDTPEEAEKAIASVLKSDIRLAVEAGSLKNLLCEVSFDLKVRWYEIKGSNPVTKSVIVPIFEGSDSTPEKRGVQSELKVFTSTRRAIGA